MVKNSERVYMDRWLSFHPYKNPSQSDFYYLKLCNEISNILEQPEYEDLDELLPQEDRKNFACFIVCYFEDVISEA